MRKTLLSFYRSLVSSLLEMGVLPRAYYLRRMNRAIISVMTPDSAEVAGHKMFLDPVDSLRLSKNGVYEPFQTRISLDKLSDGDVALDIGSNIGYYTLLFAKQVGPEGKIYSFEAEPDNYQILKRNVMTNHYKNVTCEMKAVSDVNGSVSLMKSLNSDGHHHIVSNDSDSEKLLIKIPSVSLDEYFEDIDRQISVIKMDIEGAELNALKGMRRLLAENDKIVIIMEFNPSALVRFGTKPRDVLEFLISMGFGLKNIVENEERLEEASIDGLLSTYTVENGRYTNLYCARK